MKNTVSRFSTFFKESNLFVQLLIVVSAVGIVAGTATVAAMVATPSDNKPADTQTTGHSKVKDAGSQTSDSNKKVANNNEVADDTATEPSQTTDTPANHPQNTQQTTPHQPVQQPEQPKPEPIYTDTYPADWKNNCGGLDTWGMSKCYSASYTAWKVNETFGNMPAWGIGSPSGDPKNWPAKADAANIPRGTEPKEHSVGIQTTGPAGWSVWVEAVNGNKITISYYNFNNNLKYGLQKDVPASRM